MIVGARKAWVLNRGSMGPSLKLQCYCPCPAIGATHLAGPLPPPSRQYFPGSMTSRFEHPRHHQSAPLLMSELAKCWMYRTVSGTPIARPVTSLRVHAKVWWLRSPSRRCKVSREPQ
ncbi:hypothetical protein P154DRAFT_22378 [Amniculicola lignicola CBS 123094]|uniref:Uncharacterized protein n=1 Tax=Amniculicola lignicola CBS 123094 TaxID=1392246 RepID=A0A6A5X260_9PLEO|nr:hypothetical protein P154DRAFT_22378 [Amniculicola lignicola CBS 123094]